MQTTYLLLLTISITVCADRQSSQRSKDVSGPPWLRAEFKNHKEKRSKPKNDVSVWNTGFGKMKTEIDSGSIVNHKPMLTPRHATTTPTTTFPTTEKPSRTTATPTTTTPTTITTSPSTTTTATTTSSAQVADG